MRTVDLMDLGASAVELMARARMAIGLALVGAGVVVAVFPEILVILLAALLVSAGLGTLASGWRMRRRAAARRESRPTYRVHDV